MRLDQGIRETAVEVIVLFTTVNRTREALAAALTLTQGLPANYKVIALRTPSSPLILEPWRSMVRLRLAVTGRLFRKCRPTLLFCHGSEAELLLNSVVRPRAIVVIGTEAQGPNSEEQAWGRWLEGSGHQVLFPLMGAARTSNAPGVYSP